MVKRLLSTIMIIVYLLVGCSNNNIMGTNNPKIGLVVSTLSNPFFVELAKGVTLKAEEFEFDLIVKDSENNVELEYNNIKELIDSGIDILIINPTDSDSVFAGIKLANDAEIPVLTIDRTSNGGQILSHIASDNVSGGKMAATYIMNALNGKGRIAELKGIAGTSAAKDRGAGFNTQIQNSTDIVIVASEIADFSRDKGYTVMKNILEVHPDLDAVFAHNDEMALGAIKAIEELNLDIIVVGFDGTDDGVSAVKLGKMALTIAQQPELMGSKSVELVKKYFDGSYIEPIILVDLKEIKEKE